MVFGALVIALGQDSSGEPPYLRLRREPDRVAGQAADSVELNDRSRACSGGVARAVLAADYLSLRFKDEVASRLGGVSGCKVRFPPRDLLYSSFGSRLLPADRRLGELRLAVRTLFDDSPVEVIHALDRPQPGAPECRLNAREKRELGWRPGTGWSPVSHCGKCDHMVFLAQDDADADALGHLGQCVKLTDACRGRVIFVGLKLGPEPGEEPVVVSVALPEQASGQRERAVEGVHLYLNRQRRFDEVLATLSEGGELMLPTMSRNEARALRRRLEEWHLVVRTVEASSEATG